MCFERTDCSNLNTRYQPDYERFGWYYTPEMKIDIHAEENGMVKMTMPEPVQKEIKEEK